MSMQRLCVIAAGGTGGHMFPAQSLAEVLLERGWRVRLSTDERGLRYVRSIPQSIEVVEARAATFGRGGLLSKGLVLPKIVWGVMQAMAQMWRDRPDIVVGFGGYPSVPTMVSAWVMNIPGILHEQNSVLGKVNCFFGPRVSRVACGVWPTQLPKGCKALYVGNPVRSGVIQRAAAPYIPPGDYPMQLLVLGGSQGARVLSDVVPSALAELPTQLLANLRVSHQAREEDIDRVSDFYMHQGIAAEVQPFFTDIPRRMSEAQLIISRSGASSIAEITVIGRPSILIPFSEATGDHQTQNARALVDAGAAILIPESILDATTLSAQISTVLSNQEVAMTMMRSALEVGKPDAAEHLADVVESVGS